MDKQTTHGRAIVFCNDDTCANFRDGVCGKDDIRVEVKTTGEFRSGQRVSFPACSDYEDARGDWRDE